MNLREIKERALYQTGNDAEDLSDFLPALDGYINDGYDRLLYAWERKHAGDADRPFLRGDFDNPELPEWCHGAMADFATWLLYRNGNPQKQQRGLAFRQAFDDVLSRLLNEGGAKGRRDTFINIYP